MQGIIEIKLCKREEKVRRRSIAWTFSFLLQYKIDRDNEFQWCRMVRKGNVK